MKVINTFWWAFYSVSGSKYDYYRSLCAYSNFILIHKKCRPYSILIMQSWFRPTTFIHGLWMTTMEKPSKRKAVDKSVKVKANWFGRVFVLYEVKKKWYSTLPSIRTSIKSECFNNSKWFLTTKHNFSVQITIDNSDISIIRMIGPNFWSPVGSN